MNEELIVAEPQSSSLVLHPVMNLSVAKQRLHEFQEFVQFYLHEGEDYGTIPGTPKPTLYKPGADKLCELYGLADSYIILAKVEDFEKGLFDYTIECQLTHRNSGHFVSAGLGCCSSYESRYRWREAKRKCPTCGKEAIIKGKQEYGGGWVCFKKKDGCGAKFPDNAPEIVSQEVGRLENPDIADTKNTIIKMAKKRSKVDAVLSATRSSGIFTQDMEDITDPSLRETGTTVVNGEADAVVSEEIAGRIIAEASDNSYFWYKLADTLRHVGDGKLEKIGEVRIASVKQSDTGQLADKIGCLAHLKVKAIAGIKSNAYILIDVVKVDKPPKPPANPDAEPDPENEEDPLTIMQSEVEPIDQPKSKTVNKAKEIEIHRLQRENAMPKDVYHEMLKRFGAEHAKEVRLGDFEAVCKKIQEFGKMEREQSV